MLIIFGEHWIVFDCKSKVIYSEFCKQNSMAASKILRNCEWEVCNLFKNHLALHKMVSQQIPATNFMSATKIMIVENPKTICLGFTFDFVYDFEEKLFGRIGYIEI